METPREPDEGLRGFMWSDRAPTPSAAQTGVRRHQAGRERPLRQQYVNAVNQLGEKIVTPVLYVPGCPPHPLTFVHAVLDLLGIE
jgi:Ni,Fe-hydrogenase III small subunit